jgi:glutamine amidotransferase
MRVVIIDYGMGNLGSLRHALIECGARDVLISHDPHEIEAAEKLILPGVGGFADGIKNLHENQLDEIIRCQTLKNHVPFLGICLGMQLLATRGYEGGEIPGLDIIPGEVKKLQPFTPGERIPHVGWNEVYGNKNNILFWDIPNPSDFYFVHSYHFIPENKSDAIGTTPYCDRFVSALNRDSVWGVQFHPEKSSVLGFRIIRNFLEYSR